VQHNPAPEAPPLESRSSRLPPRTRRLPKRYRDELPPVPLPVVATIDDTIDPQPADDDLPHPTPEPAPIFRTEANEFGVYREYYGSLPSYTPDEISDLSDLCDSPALLNKPDSSPEQAPPLRNPTQQSFFRPFSNPTVFRVMNWFHGLSNLKSQRELDRLVREVILAEDFSPNDLQGFSAEREVARLDSYQDDESPIFSASDGWTHRSVPIRVPAENVRHPSEDAAPIFHVDGLYYRNIVEVVKSALQEPSAKQYHLSPYREFWKPSEDAPAERIYSEIYSSDVVIEEHQKIKAEQRDCTLETVVIPMLLWSDSTHLASFGTASLWPIYLFIRNLSKYVRCKPLSFSAHHIAYIPKVRYVRHL
jgi:hypothetical protein